MKAKEVLPQCQTLRFWVANSIVSDGCAVVDFQTKPNLTLHTIRKLQFRIFGDVLLIAHLT